MVDFNGEVSKRYLRESWFNKGLPFVEKNSYSLTDPSSTLFLQRHVIKPGLIGYTPVRKIFILTGKNDLEFHSPQAPTKALG